MLVVTMLFLIEYFIIMSGIMFVIISMCCCVNCWLCRIALKKQGNLSGLGGM